MATLKPQDVAVVLKLCCYAPQRPPYSVIASELSMSPSEVHAAVKRALGSRLLHGPKPTERPNYAAIEEFLIHGLKYAFPAERGELTRGVPTSYAAEPLRQVIALGDEPPPVWPYPTGTQRGIAFGPLYKQAPEAALRDPVLYELLALADALRDGRARERKLAEEMMVSRLRSTVHV
jgi:DNA-binding Lrp family transcriptional regulator